jgi:uncharacterized protein
MYRFVSRPNARFLLLYLPMLAVIVFQCVIRLSSREIRLVAYQVFFNEFFWLSIPYAALALVFFVATIRTRKWIAATGALLACTLGVAAFYSRFIEPERIVVHKNTLQVGAALRVALISDLHIGLFQGRDRTAQIVTTLNALDIDVVLVAGDWTYEPTAALRDLLAPFAQSRHRILSVPGNHDEEMPGPPLAAELRAALVEHGVEPIEGQVITVKGVRFVGIGDRWARKDFVPTLADQSTPLVALTHNPDSVDRLRDTPIRTLLAGHTHGGQINLPIITDWVLQSATRQGFKKGLYQRGAQQVFVTSGLGMVGLPLRLFQPPVIDVITFR